MSKKIKIDRKEITIHPFDEKALNIISKHVDMVCSTEEFRKEGNVFYLPTLRSRNDILGLRTHLCRNVNSTFPKCVIKFVKENPDVHMCVQGDQRKIKAILKKIGGLNV